MANIKSQKKRNLTNAKRAERNKAVKSELKTRVKTADAPRSAPTATTRTCASPSSASTWPPPRASSTRTRPPAARAA